MTYYLRQPATKHRFRALSAIGLMICSSILSMSIGMVKASSGIMPVSLPQLLITEVQTGGICATATVCTEDTAQEFVEVYNTGSTNLVVTNWTLRQLSSTGATHTDLVALNGTFASHKYALFAHAGYFADKADAYFGASTDSGKLPKSVGHVEIINSSGVMVDRVGWGDAKVALTSPIKPLPAIGQSIERKTDIAGLLINSGNNLNDFANNSNPEPEGGGYTVNEPAEPTPTPPPATLPSTNPAPALEPTTSTAPTVPNPTPVPVPITPPTSIPSALDCDDIAISELLPNPAGTDTGHEFIEIHNLTGDVLKLDGCILQTSGSSTKSFTLTGSLGADNYRAFYDTTTGLTLPNAAGGTVTLASQITEQRVVYPGDMNDDTTWALTGKDTWAASFSATPDAANIATPHKSCEAGQVRNPDSNRCISAVAGSSNSNDSTPSSVFKTTTPTGTSATTPCKENQERNAATNRCRNVVAGATSTAAAGTATACKAGQERNPDTNRCRNIAATASSTAKACPTGQERNAETNRCRKITAAGSTNGSTLDGVKDVASASATKSKPYWLIAVAALGAAIAYGLYEWRQEIMMFVRKHTGKSLPMLQPATR